MARCTRCGNELGPDNRFCAVCGQPVNPSGIQQMPFNPPPAQAYYPPPKKTNGAIIVVILIVAIIVVGAIIASFTLSPTSGSGDGSIDDEMIIEVNDGYVAHSQGIFLTPEAGNKFVVYNVTVTNNKGSDLTFSILSFQLHTAGGLVYDPSYTAGTTLSGTPESLSAGASYSFVLAYEIPEGDHGSRIVYDWLFDHGSTNVPV